MGRTTRSVEVQRSRRQGSRSGLRGAAVSEQHPDDEFHPPTSDDPYWTETCWFTFTVPERRLSGQLYPFFRPNQGVLSAGAFFWDHTGGTPADILHARQFWHLPIPDQPLSDIALPNGITYRCVEPLRRYALTYDDPDATGPSRQRHPRRAHVQRHRTPQLSRGVPPRSARSLRGTIVLAGEEIPVDAFGFRDRSWGPRTQFGRGIHNSGAMSGGYSYATASEGHAFHAITMDFGSGALAIHGYILRDGERSKVVSGTRRVLERDPRTAYPAPGRARPGRRVGSGGPRRRRLPQRAGPVPEPQSLHGQLPDRVDLRRHHGVR